MSKPFKCPVCQCEETHINVVGEDNKRRDWLLALKNPSINSVCVLRMCKSCGVVVGFTEQFDTSESVSDKERAVADHVTGKKELPEAAITKDAIAEVPEE
jgi:hypothetical protein